jgi:hypothetical protein
VLTAPSSGFGGLGVSVLASGTQVAGSNPAEAVGFLRAEKSSARLPVADLRHVKEP